MLRKLMYGVVLALLLSTAFLTVALAADVIEDFEVGGEHVAEDLFVFNQAWQPASYNPDYKVIIDTQSAVSGTRSMRVEGTPVSDYAGVQVFFLDRNAIAAYSPEWFLKQYSLSGLKDKGLVAKDLSNYSTLSLMYRPEINLPPKSMAIRVTVNGKRTDYMYPVNDEPIFAGQWTKVSFDLTAIKDRKGTAVLRFYPNRVVTTPFAFNVDDLTLE